MQSNALLLSSAAVFGACMGSFLNVVAHRSVEGRSWWGKERSVCESCGRVLPPFELIPVFSWLVQRGRCRGCGARISARYVVVELVGAAGTAGIAWRYGASWPGVLSLVGFLGLLLNALTDLESGEVFDAFALAMGLGGLAVRLAGGWPAVLDGLTGAAAGWGIFALIIVVSRGGMGWGDANFMGGAGAVLGWKLTLLAFYIGVMAGGVGAAYLLLRGRARLGRGDSIPLVPYLSAGCYAAILFGTEILAWVGMRINTGILSVGV